jgi:hypothetical protein
VRIVTLTLLCSALLEIDRLGFSGNLLAEEVLEESAARKEGAQGSGARKCRKDTY